MAASQKNLPTGPIPQTGTGTLTAFSKFSCFPPEIRQMIFEAFLNVPRFTEIHLHPKHHRGYDSAAPDTEIFAGGINPLFHVNCEARAIASKVYQIKKDVRGFQFIPPQTLVNSKYDTVYCSTGELSSLIGLGKDVYEKVRSLAPPQDLWVDMIERGANDAEWAGSQSELLTNLEEVVIIPSCSETILPAIDETGDTIRQFQYTGPINFSDEWDAVGRISQFCRCELFANFRFHIGSTSIIAQSPNLTLWNWTWSFMAEDVAKRWNAHMSRLKMKKGIRVRRGLICYTTGAATEIAFPGGDDKPDVIRDTRLYNEYVQGFNDNVLRDPAEFLPLRSVTKPPES